MNSSYENYQYNSCISRGICSINPRISALQTVLVLYLRLFAKFASEITIDNATKNFILNTISITLFNPNFNEKSFSFAIEIFQIELPKIIGRFYETRSIEELEKEKNKTIELFKETSSIIDSIKYGEKTFNKAQKEIASDIRNMYNLILLIVKNLSINLIELNDYNKDFEPAFQNILSLLSSINIDEKNLEELKSAILEAVEVDNKLMKLIREAQEEKYGYQEIKEVSFSTTPNKAVLVVGSNIKELENVLEALQNQDIDVYTHDDMMLAHTFPKFSEYPHLKGQFGFGLENCLLDFATFPGPIILTKNSLHNIENFYRGRLFTTDYTSAPKGIIKIEHNDFSQVIDSALSSKGFKKGKNCESINVGYNFKQLQKNIKEKFETFPYKKIFIISHDSYSLENKTYFEKLIKKAPKDILIISFSYESEKENLIHINNCFDYYSLIKIFEYLHGFDLAITVFIPKCERSSISQIIHLSKFSQTKVFIGKCTPIILNPSLLNTFQKTFNIKSLGIVKKDLEEVLK